MKKTQTKNIEAKNSPKTADVTGDPQKPNSPSKKKQFEILNFGKSRKVNAVTTDAQDPKKSQQYKRSSSVNTQQNQVQTKRFSRVKTVEFLKSLKNVPINSWKGIRYIVSFSYLLTILLSSKGIIFVGNSRFFPQSLRNKLSSPLERMFKKLTSPYKYDETTINRSNLIELALRNMTFKKSRSFITIGGMSIGIGIIVFLVSIGFGLQDLVISRVARLDELRQADVFVQTGSKIKIDDKTIADINNLDTTEKVLPLVAVVGKVNYNDSLTDVAVYGVSADYLKSSAIKPVKGRIFENNEYKVELPKKSPLEKVAGTSDRNILAKEGLKIQNVDFLLDQGSWVPVREQASTRSKLLGYTRRVPGIQYGEEFWGGSYISNDNAGAAGITVDGENLGRWVKSTFKLWKNEVCLVSEDPDCEENQYVIHRDSQEIQIEDIGYIQEVNISINGLDDLELIENQNGDFEAKVLGVQTAILGDATDSANLADSTDTSSDLGSAAGLSYSEYGISASEAAELGIAQLIATGSGALVNDGKEVEIGKKAVREAIVNRAMLSILGITEEEAVGKEFQVSFVVEPNLTDGNEKLKSKYANYTIVGVDPESSTPFFYVPFIDIRTLGASNYSQLKVVANKESDLPSVRQQVEVLGYATSSVVDTVAQINSFFGTLRLVLALVGAVALAVAALGMFNTLTVSLLERTREVGLMKAMGMRSYEVQELFLTESLIMGFFGGILGIAIGIGTGKILSIILSAFALSKNAGVIDIASTPLAFIALTMAFSLTVGLLTGIFPARRATKISALDALRYE